jgi:hypothetical protein
MAGSIALRHHMPNIRSIYRRRFQRARICAIPRPHLVKYCCNPRFNMTTSNVRLVVTRVQYRACENTRLASTGNTIVTLSWEPSQFYPPEDEDPVDENIYTGNSGPSADGSAWQYCLAPSYAENKVYISSPFPKSAPLSNTETAFAKMLFQSEIQHNAVQCPNGNDEPSISNMRQHAISFNHELGNTIITLNWKP